jgi:transcriptional regulator with XRE-family HTH domain
MAGGKRRDAQVIGAGESHAIAANLGRELRATRRRRRLTQDGLGRRVGLSQSEISLLELGRGSRAAIETWVSIGIALNRPIAIGFSRDVLEPLNDAGHLEAQELVARIATAGGWRVTFEAPDDPRAPVRSTDLRIDRPDAVVLVEIWNRLDDLGAAVRSSDRKLAAAPDGAGSVWIPVDTAANREIVRRYPAVLRSRFGGSSGAWVLAIASGGPPPILPGLVWADVRGGTLGALRPLQMSSAGRHTRSS